MEYPKQIDEAAELAEQLHAKMFNQAPQEEEVNEEQAEQPEPQEEETEQSDVPHDDDVEELRKFKDRYLSLKGKYDAEVPRLHQELKEFKQSVFERLEQSKPQPQQDQPQQEDRFAKFKEEYGEELYEAMKELTRAQAEELIAQKIQPVQQHVANVEDTQIQAARQNFMGYLDQTVKGDWKALWSGQDPKFIEFLKQPDPSGLYTYGELVQAYNDNWDADRLGLIMNSYLESQAPAPKPKAQRPEQNAMVAPSRTTTHNTPASSDKRIWTQDAMREFQAKDMKGAYTPEESQALWNDLLAAPSEGRMR